MAFIKTTESRAWVRSASLLGIFILAKLLALAGREITLSVWTLPAFIWQDVLVVICFGALDRVIGRAWFAWTLYGVIILYVAINLPLIRVLSTPMTWTMMRAARGTLADSVMHHLTIENVSLMLFVLSAGLVLPATLCRMNARPRRPATCGLGQWGKVPSSSERLMELGICAGLFSSLRRRWILYAGAGSLLLLGPMATGRIETAGLHRNAVVGLVTSAFPRVAPRHVEKDWRTSPFGRTPGSTLVELRGAAAGRNIVLILLESTGAQYLKLYGSPDDPTPNLTALADESIVIENAYAVYPESIKGLFSVLCSRYPALDTRSEMYEHVPCDSIAQVLSNAGYRTALFHSGRFMYLGMESIIQNRGYQTLEDAGDIGGNHNSSFGVDEPSTVRRMLGWVDSLSNSNRFFITYLPIAGHHPYDAPEGGPFPDADEVGRYRNALHDGDAAVGALIRGLRQRNLYQNTLFVIFGDHGEAFGQHEGNYGHTLNIYEENIRVPYVIAAPGLFKERKRVPGTVSLIDTMPTILDLVGLKIPSGCQGRSLLLGADQMALFYADYSLGLLGLRDERWKYIYELESGRSKLFDLDQDPREQKNLSVTFSGRTEAYRAHLSQWSAAQKEMVNRSNSGATKTKKHKINISQKGP
jgi:hypothetical protein